MKNITTISTLILSTLILTQQTKSNVWDNLYSQYYDKPINHLEQFTALYKLREFSNLGLALKIRYDQTSQRIAIELLNHESAKQFESSFVYLNFDFNNLDI